MQLISKDLLSHRVS